MISYELAKSLKEAGFMNQIFELTWTDEDGTEHIDQFPSYDEALDYVELLKEEFVVESYKIEKLQEL